MKVVIVGGVAGGASAAARLRRLDENAEIILLERGDHISFANCGLPYYLGGVIVKRQDLLLQTPESFTQRFKVDVRVGQEVSAIDRAHKTVSIRSQATGQNYSETYDYLVLAPGAEPLRPPIPGADLPGVFYLRNLADTDRLKERIQKSSARDALIVGGGFIGLEMMENLHRAGLNLTVLELAGQVMDNSLDYEMAAILRRHIEEQGVNLKLRTALQSVAKSGDKLACRFSDGGQLSFDMVVMAVGIRPETKLAKDAGLELGINGAIRVDQHLRTSDPYIYAVGDAIQVRDIVSGQPAFMPMAGPANRQGRMVADIICGRPQMYAGSLGSRVVKVLDLVAAATGNTEKQLKQQGRVYGKVYLHPSSHASYYPGSGPLSLKLLFDPQTAKLLGAQALGRGGVDKRINVLATALQAGLTVYDLQNLELCYAPPFSSAKDPVNLAGYLAGNVLQGDLKQFFSEDMSRLQPEQDQLLDLRTSKEYAQGTIGQALHIPLDELRRRLPELPKNKRLIVFCRSGLRSYLGCRILQQNGYEVYNLSGGYLTWESVTGSSESYS